MPPSVVVGDVCVDHQNFTKEEKIPTLFSGFSQPLRDTSSMN
jgi:hypothetical protein